MSSLPSQPPEPDSDGRDTAVHGQKTAESNEVRASVDTSPRTIHGIKWFLAITAILSSTLLFSLDNTIVAVVQPSIVNGFGSVDKLPWLGAAFALGSILILPWSKAYGVFNVKILYCAHVLAFELGSAVCGAAPNMNAMILGRLIALHRDKNRGDLFSQVGGAFADSAATWRWAFYINLVIGAILAPIYLFLLPNVDFQRSTPLFKKLGQTDWLGVLFFSGAMACLVMAIDFGGSLYDWDSGSEITLWVISGVLFVVFGLTQTFTPFISPEQKLYPSHFLRRPVLLNLQFQLFLASGILFGAAYYIPLYFQFTQGDSPLAAAVRLLPFIFMVATFALLNGAIMSKTGYYMPWYIFGGCLTLIGSTLMFTVQPSTTPAKVYGYTILIGIGVGSIIQAGWSVAECQAPRSETSGIIGFMSIGQAIGIVVFFATIGTIYHSRAIAEVHSILPTATNVDLNKVLAGTSSDFFETLTAADRASIVDAIIRAMRAAWAMLIAAGACALVAAPFLPRTKYFEDAKRFG
ncbi:MAG: hypothetical protein Q9219_006138 [cf. Caloplaca sp. 3 TL-2023]